MRITRARTFLLAYLYNDLEHSDGTRLNSRQRKTSGLDAYLNPPSLEPGRFGGCLARTHVLAGVIGLDHDITPASMHTRGPDENIFFLPGLFPDCAQMEILSTNQETRGISVPGHGDLSPAAAGVGCKWSYDTLRTRDINLPPSGNTSTIP